MRVMHDRCLLTTSGMVMRAVGAALMTVCMLTLPSGAQAADNSLPPLAGTSASKTSGGSGGSNSAAGTSATMTSPVPAASAPVAAPPPAAVAITPSGEDASGKPPPPAKIKAAAAPDSSAKKQVHAKRKAKPAVIAEAPPAPAEPPSLFDTLFGNGQPPAAAVVAADPTTTAATDQIGQKPGKGKAGKGSKTAKNTIEPAATAIPDAGFFNAEEVPFASGELGQPLLSPGNIEPLKTAIKRYTGIVANGGWPTVPPLQMQVGTSNPAVVELRQRLAAEGDLKSQPSGFSGPEYFDQDVSDAVHHFQNRYGLTETGDLMDTDKLKNGTRTVMALNVPAEARLAQLKGNLTRLQREVVPKGRYVLVNIPGEQIEAIDGNKVALRLNGVVGKPERPSPLLSSNITEVKFNPTWTVPPTVLKEDLIPKGQSLQAKGVDVLTKFGIDAYDGNGKLVDTSKINWSSNQPNTLRFSEKAGKDNPLGFAKLDFNSPESVYMHDTPSAKLFDKSYRAASSGCIRVDHMDRLVMWLMKETEGWGPARVLSMKESGESKIVSLKKAVPLRWVYVTAWATEDGTVHFRRDLYGKDQVFGVSKTASAY